MKKQYLRFPLFSMLVVLLILAGMLLKFTVLADRRAGPGKVEERTLQVEYQVEVKDITQDVLNELREGSSLYFGMENALAGTITSLESAPAKIVETIDGKERTVTVSDRYDVEMTIEASILRTTIDAKTDMDISGSTLTEFRNQLVVFSGHITSCREMIEETDLDHPEV